MLKYGKTQGELCHMSLKKAYNISIVIILTVIFTASFLIGTALRSAPSASIAEEKEGTGFSIAPADFEEPPETVTALAEPIETEICDYTASSRFYDIPLDDVQQRYVFELCGEYDLPCELVFAVMGAESNYADSQISRDGDYGIMQINSVNHAMLSEKLGVSDFLDFEQNVLCGVYMLSEYYHRYVDFNKIAMCYRYGEQGAVQMWEQGIYETDYTRMIVRNIALLDYRSI